jgi:hypothetical protein
MFKLLQPSEVGNTKFTTISFIVKIVLIVILWTIIFTKFENPLLEIFSWVLYCSYFFYFDDLVGFYLHESFHFNRFVEHALDNNEVKFIEYEHNQAKFTLGFNEYYTIRLSDRKESYSIFEESYCLKTDFLVLGNKFCRKYDAKITERLRELYETSRNTRY